MSWHPAVLMKTLILKPSDALCCDCAWCILGVRNGLMAFQFTSMGKTDLRFKWFELQAWLRNQLGLSSTMVVAPCLHIQLRYFVFVMLAKRSEYLHKMQKEMSLILFLALYFISPDFKPGQACTSCHTAHRLNQHKIRLRIYYSLLWTTAGRRRGRGLLLSSAGHRTYQKVYYDDGRLQIQYYAGSKCFYLHLAEWQHNDMVV